MVRDTERECSSEVRELKRVNEILGRSRTRSSVSMWPGWARLRRSMPIVGLFGQIWMTPVPGQVLQPTVFAPGVVSVDGESLYRGQFTPDGGEFYFFRPLEDGEENYRIWFTRSSGDGWTPAEQLRFSPDASDMYPTFSPDGEVMVMSSYRPAPGTDVRQANLWFSRRDGRQWTAPVFMSEQSNTDTYNPGPWFGPDGHLYWVDVTWGATGRRLHRRATWDGSSFGSPEANPYMEPWESWRTDRIVWDVTPAPDDTFVILGVSVRDAATGATQPSDLFVSFRDGDEWTEPIDLGPGVNTAGFENFVSFTPDGTRMLFVRDFETAFQVPVEVLRTLAR